MKRKILAFIFNGKNILTLFSEPHPKHGDGGWFTVTGAVEGNESLEDAVKREVKEETNLEVKEIFNLNWGSIYEWSEEECQESNFVVFVDENEIKLNEEHTKFRWLDIEKFVYILKWDDDKELLKKVLKSALKKRLVFKKPNFIDYRKR